MITATELSATWMRCPLSPVVSGATSPDRYPDTEYGATQRGSWYHNVPPLSFMPNVISVTQPSDITDNLATAPAGTCFLVENGSYDWDGTRINLVDGNGTESDPIYILAATPLGVTFTGVDVWDARSDYLVIGGFNYELSARPSSGSTLIQLHSKWFRYTYTHHKLFDTGYSLVVNNSTSQSQHLEFDNNTVDGTGTAVGTQGFIGIQSEEPLNAAPGSGAKHIRIHHNEWSNIQYNSGADCHTHRTGNGGDQTEGTPTNNPDGNNGYVIIENNRYDAWDGEEELMEIKIGSTLIRNNHAKSMPNGKLMTRGGSRVMWTGNWVGGCAPQVRFSGRECAFVFNYVEHTANAGYAFGPHRGYTRTGETTMNYTDTRNGLFKHNVFNRLRGVIWYYGYGSGPNFYRHAENSIYSGNVFHGNTLKAGGDADDGNYYDHGKAGDDPFTAAEFRAINDWSGNTYVFSNLAQTPDPDPALFTGPGTVIDSGIPDVWGSPRQILPPSWWS